MQQVLALLDAQGIPYRLRGGLAVAKCPLHQDHEPSFVVYPDDHFMCYGCAQRGHVGDLARRLLFPHEPDMHKAYRQAFDYLRKIGAVSERGGPDDARFAFESPAPTERQKAILTEAAALFHRQLSRRQWDYLRQRGVSEGLVDHYLLGYCANHPGLLELGSTEELTELGLLSGTGRQAMYGRITLPAWSGGQVVFIQGRSLFPKSRLRYRSVKVRRQLYFAGEVALHPFGVKDAVVWLVEGVFDALALKSLGQQAVAIGGTSPRNGSLAAFAGKRVLLALDADEAGRVAAAGLAQALSSAGAEVYAVDFPAGIKDPGDLAQKGLLRSWCEEKLSSLPFSQGVKG